MLPTSAGVEPVTSWSPVARRIQLSHRGLRYILNLFQFYNSTFRLWNFEQHFQIMEFWTVLSDYGILNITYSFFFSELSKYMLVFIYKVLCLSSDCLRLHLVHCHPPNARLFTWHRHLGFPIGTILPIFISTSHPNPSYQFSNQLALWFRKISEKKSFKMAAMMAIFDFRSKQFKLF